MPEEKDMGCDYNRNGEVDIWDLDAFMRHYNTKKGDNRFHYFYDFNGDGKIDIYDLVHIASKVTNLQIQPKII